MLKARRFHDIMPHDTFHYFFDAAASIFRFDTLRYAAAPCFAAAADSAMPLSPMSYAKYNALALPFRLRYCFAAAFAIHFRLCAAIERAAACYAPARCCNEYRR